MEEAVLDIMVQAEVEPDTISAVLQGVLSMQPRISQPRATPSSGWSPTNLRNQRLHPGGCLHLS